MGHPPNYAPLNGVLLVNTAPFRVADGVQVELVWNRTLAMVVESALVKTDIEMESLVSIYNPNRLGARYTLPRPFSHIMCGQD